MPAINELSYADEKLSMAIYSLVGVAPIQKRLESAYLSFHTLSLGKFRDPDMQASWESIMDKLTAIKDPIRGHVPATCAAINDEEGEELAREIVDLYFVVTNAKADARVGL